MKKLLLILWQLPQCMLAWVLLLVYKGDAVEYRQGVYVRSSPIMGGGISLGPYIIVNPRLTAAGSIDHEYGHCIQSMYLGPIYLMVVGLPSVLWALFYGQAGDGYYQFYTERWADRLGGVKR